MDIKQALLDLPAKQLKRAILIRQRIERLESQIQDVLEAAASPGLQTVVKAKRRMSVAARAKIAKAARARWAKWRRTRNSVD